MEPENSVPPFRRLHAAARRRQREQLAALVFQERADTSRQRFLTSPRLPGRRRIFAVVAVSAAIAALFALQPARLLDNGSVGAVDHALASVSNGPVLHAALELPLEEVTIGPGTRHFSVVELASGHERPVMTRLELWYDPSSNRLRSVSSVEGAVLFERLETSDAVSGVERTSTTVDPALAAFFKGYRAALEEGRATVVRTEVIDGRSVEWLRFPPTLPGQSAQELAVDSETFTPVRLRTVCAACSAEPPSYRVVTLEGMSLDGANLAPPKERKPRSVATFETRRRQIDLLEAPSALGTSALWPGGAVGGLELVGVVRVDASSHSSVPATTENAIASSTGIQLAYGGEMIAGRHSAKGVDWITVSQSSDYRQVFGGFNFNNGDGIDPRTFGGAAVPREGEVALTLIGHGLWVAQLRADGLFVEIDGSSRALVLEAARSLKLLAP